VVSTFAERHALARAAASSWLTQCDGALVLSDRDDESVPATGVPHAGPEGAESWQKSHANWRVLHALVARGNASYDYVIYGGDGYIVLVDNLRSLLDSAPLRSQHERSAPLFLGRRFTSWRHQHASLSHFNAGGPGVVLNSHALRLLGPRLDEAGGAPPRSPCLAESSEDEDVAMALCLQTLGVAPSETRDSLGRERIGTASRRSTCPLAWTAARRAASRFTTYGART